ALVHLLLYSLHPFPPELFQVVAALRTVAMMKPPARADDLMSRAPPPIRYQHRRLIGMRRLHHVSAMAVDRHGGSHNHPSAGCRDRSCRGAEPRSRREGEEEAREAGRESGKAGREDGFPVSWAPGIGRDDEPP